MNFVFLNFHLFFCIVFFGRRCIVVELFGAEIIIIMIEKKKR